LRRLRGMGSVRSRIAQAKTECLVVSALFLGGFLFFLGVFARNRLVPGIDGPYYLIQVRSLLGTGRLVYGDPPLTFYLFALFALLVGDVALGVKVGVSLFCALSMIPAYFLARRVAGKAAGYLAMVFVLSPLYIRMMTDFMKNAVGVVFLLSFLYYLHDMAFSGRNRRNLSLTLLFLLLTGLTHILDLGVALLILGLYLAAVTVLDVNRREFAKSVAIVVLFLGGFAAVAVAAFSSLFTDFSKGLTFLRDLFATPEEHPSLPLFPPTGGRQGPAPPPGGPVPAPRIPLSWVVLVSTLALGCVMAVYERKRRKEAAALLSVVTLTGILLSLPFIPPQWLWRLLLMEFIPVALILSYGLWRLSHRLLRIEQRGVAVFLVSICLIPFLFQSVNTALHVRPTIDQPGLHDLEEMKARIPEGSVVVLYVGEILYWVEYVGDIDIAHRPSEELWQSYAHVLGLLRRNDPRPRVRALIKGSEPLFEGEVFLLVELPGPAALGYAKCRVRTPAS